MKTHFLKVRWSDVVITISIEISDIVQDLIIAVRVINKQNSSCNLHQYL